MDNNIQIQSLKSQIEHMKLQIDNIVMQNNNMNMMINNPIYEQLVNLSIQMLNTGIQAFNIGKKMIFNKDKFYGQLKIISEQINQIINENDVRQQQMMMQQMQQQMMMQQQMIMQQQMMANQQVMAHRQLIALYQENANINIEFINVLFQDNVLGGKTRVITMKIGTTIKELLNKYIKQYHGNINFQLKFLYNARRLEINEERKIEDVFKNFLFIMTNPTITVINEANLI